MVAPNHLYKSGHSEKAVPQIIYKLFFVHLSKALAAINRAVFSWLERNLCLFAAVCASCSEHLAVRLGCILTVVTASLASLRLVLESLFGIKFLLTCGKDEILTAILAFKGLVFEHFATSLNMDK